MDYGKHYNLAALVFTFGVWFCFQRPKWLLCSSGGLRFYIGTIYTILDIKCDYCSLDKKYALKKGKVHPRAKDGPERENKPIKVCLN